MIIIIVQWLHDGWFIVLSPVSVTGRNKIFWTPPPPQSRNPALHADY